MVSFVEFRLPLAFRTGFHAKVQDIHDRLAWLHAVPVIDLSDFDTLAIIAICVQRHASFTCTPRCIAFTWIKEASTSHPRSILYSQSVVLCDDDTWLSWAGSSVETLRRSFRR